MTQLEHRFAQKAGKLVTLVLFLVIGCIVLLFLLSKTETGREILYFKRMEDFAPQFDRLNRETLSQIPIYPDAQRVNLQIMGADDLFDGSIPRTLSAYYISSDSPEQIYQFLIDRLLVQEWQTQGPTLSPPYPDFLHFRKGYACITIYVEYWDAGDSPFIHYEPSSTDNAPVSWYEITIEHALEAVPGMPKPPNMSLFGCLSEDRKP